MRKYNFGLPDRLGHQTKDARFSDLRKKELSDHLIPMNLTLAMYR